MPAAPLYRVVESECVGKTTTQKDIGCEWKPERKAKDELREMKLKQPHRWLSIQKQSPSKS